VTTSQHHDPATLLVALYCVVDDLYREHFASRKPVRPGRRPELSDSEVLTIALLAQWRQDRSERAFLAYARRHLRSYFPRLLHQSAFNRRARDLMGVLCALGPAIKQRASVALGLPPSTYEVLDGVPVPLMRRCRGTRHRLFRDEAAIGRGGSDKEWYYGVKMLAAVDDHGFLGGFLAGPANTEERWLADAFFRWRLDPTLPGPTADDLARVLGPTHRRGGQRRGPTGPLGPRPGVGRPSSGHTIGDLNYAGEAWNRHWRHDYGAGVLTEAIFEGLDGPARRQLTRRLHSLRQTVETTFAQLVSRFGLKFPRARTLWGLYTRLAAKVAAHNLSLYLNHLFGQPLLSACDPLA
jgi:hypothetical protein